MIADNMRKKKGRVIGDDPLGSVGNQNLILGDSMAGYFGTVNGLVTNTQLTNLMAMTSGTLLDSANTDITFHKFIHKGRILLIPSRPIKHTISWDNIQAQNGVKGKVINIGGQEYLCRLMTGTRHYYTNNPSIAGGEWENLIVGFQSHLIGFEYSKMTYCQEVSTNVNNRFEMVLRGFQTLINYYQTYIPSTSTINTSWRPVLEVL